VAEDDVTVKIGADTSDLDAKMARAQQMMQQGFTPLPVGLGGPPQSLLERATEKAKTQTPEERDAAVRKYAQAAKEATGATNQLSEAQEGLAQATDRTASAFEAMVTRMMMRMVVLYIIHEIIKAIIAVLRETSAYEEARVRFENLSTAVEGGAKAWEHLRQVAHETGISQEDLGQAQMSLEKMGVSGAEVGGVMENLAKYAKILGVDIGTVAQEWGRLERKEGSVKDMQDLAYATHDINLQRLVNDLAEAQRMAPILAQEMAEIDRQANREAEDRDRALNRAMEDTERLRNAQLGVAQAMHLAGRAFQEFMGGGRTGGPAGQMTERLKSEMALGEAQLAREGEPSARQMRQMGMSGKEVYQVLMEAAKRYHEQERINLQRWEEDDNRKRQRAQEDARKNVQLEAAQNLLKAEDKVTQAIEKGIGANTAFGKAMETAAGLSDLIKEHMKEIVDDATIINDAIKGWNSFVLTFVDTLKQVEDIIIRIAKELQNLFPWKPNVPEYGTDPSRTEAGRKAAGLPEPVYHHVPGYLGRTEPTAGDKFNEMVRNQGEQKKEQQDANRKLDQIHGVLQQAFGT
jgi:hypothetical protein